ncbi:MAG: stage III sporulation protein AA, partial [Thermoanaerobacteraceae bacterium]
MILGENFFELLNSLPSNVREIINKIPKDIIEKTEEIRLRLNRPLMIDINNEENLVSSEGKFVKNIKDSYIITHEDCNKALQLISKSSLYAFEEELKNGYITLKGGYRVGIVGKCVIENGYIKTMRNISGYNYRIMRELKGVSDNIISYIVKSPKEVKNTLIISPPQCGKTTLIRDIARNISNGIEWLGFKGLNIGIIDERSEISACYNGVPQVDVGIRTDVLDGCPKSSGILMMIRSMSPKVIITDE